MKRQDQTEWPAISVMAIHHTPLAGDSNALF